MFFTSLFCSIHPPNCVYDRNTTSVLGFTGSAAAASGSSQPQQQRHPANPQQTMPLPPPAPTAIKPPP
ncbi:MAG: hypothetical protein HC895_01220, partial [Leptolyngbyaceae cyanobacterium SM1_3_5]|nr:hypothetical protein [Leptolyngbyaceae cyanobacterium SM1_3_5]